MVDTPVQLESGSQSNSFPSTQLDLQTSHHNLFVQNSCRNLLDLTDLLAKHQMG
jgi:hypothetical protein